jgi:serine/threonine-protein kinase
VVPTRLQPSIPPLGGMSASGTHAVGQSGTHAIGSGARPALPDPHRGNALVPGELLRKRRGKLVFAIAALVGLAAVSFVIALAASKQKTVPAATAPHDAAQVAVAADATALTVEPLPVAPPPLDASAEPAIPADAEASPVEDEMAHLIVRTIPDGGTVKVGDQARVATKQPGDLTGSATAHLLLPPGKHVVTAELAGYRPEKRTVVLSDNDNQRIEITFTKKIVTHQERGPEPGRLTVRTTPWSDVYLGSKKLGQAPFADLELPAGTHTLTFKNPSRPTVTKSVTIKPGKSTKLNFNL